ncbi:predicted protein [Lichtheimia corymbifera JMRC:FSU:9682]|uniref:Protein kinase domain-containing protein n=1 Tax=Lichtheimia corymbifera JMRC:FSU:9682 TaxID=1263082 RepID=A0A068RFS4_9FUNG|nr:predicted protein [Lichtheimia corymbifera JMRC:FSU:9682]
MRQGLFSRFSKLLLTRHRNSKHNTTKKAGDWQQLSPESPPLPVLDLSSPTSSSSPNTTTSLPASTKRDFIVKRSSFPNTAIYDPRQSRRLYTIPEEAETMTITTTTTTTPSCSRLRDGQQHCMTDNNTNNINTNGNIPSPTSPDDILYQAPNEWISAMQPVDEDSRCDNQLIGDEPRCQLQMSQRIQRAYQSHQRRSTGNNSHLVSVAAAARTELDYDCHDNITGLRITCPSGTSEYWPLHGNSQYIPPEVAIQGIYHPQLAQVWIMGVWLYRMLVGKYPYAAPNDRKLFTKMGHGDFTIPCHLSEDAKDLLRRMLAPHPGRRASLDLVMFHPWLKSCSSHDTSRRQSMESISSYRRHRTSRHHHSNNIQAAPNKSFAVTKAVKFLTHGPYPPPRRPYRELALLGQRASSTVI